MAEWAMPETVLRVFLRERFPAATVSAETPKDLETKLPFIRLAVVGGADDRLTDSTVIDVETFAASRYDAGILAEEVRDAILSFQGREDSANRWLIDTTDTLTRPRWVDYRNPLVQRYVGTYSVGMRPLR